MKRFKVMAAVAVFAMMLVGCGGGQGVVEEEQQLLVSLEPIVEATPEPVIVPTPIPESTPESDQEEGYQESELITFTHIIGGFGFVLGEDWGWQITQQDGSLSILVEENQLIISLIGPQEASAHLSEVDRLSLERMLLLRMMEEFFSAQNVVITDLTQNELGFAVFRADYTMVVGGTTLQGVGFLVSNGEQMAILSGVMTFAREELIAQYLDFVASLRFAEAQPLTTQTFEAVPREWQNALQAGRDYLHLMPFSLSGLTRQLEFEGYPAEAVDWAMQQINAETNWRMQALRSGEQYLATMSFSRTGLIDQLIFEGFSRDDASYVADRLFD